MSEPIQTMRQQARALGWRALLLAPVSARLSRHFGLQIYRIRTRKLDARLPDYDSARFSLRQLNGEDLHHATADPELGISAEFAIAALQRGDVCFGAYCEGRLAAYNWRTGTAAPDKDDVWVRVHCPYRYGYKAFTHPNYRRQRLNAVLSHFSDSYYLQRGYLYEIAYVHSANRPALLTGVAKGMTPIGYVVFVRVFGRLLSWRSSAVRRAGFEVFDHSRTQPSS